jgi:hypothetical protein
VRQLIHPSSLDIGPKSRTRLALSLDTTDLDPDVPLNGELIISVEGRQDYSVAAPVMFGRPPEAEIQPDIVQLGNVFAGNIVPMQFSVRNC